jgi:ubiquinone/menaquinone biosynthesis C-methylase UbiE
MTVADARTKSRDLWHAMARGWDERHAYFEQTSRPVTDGILRQANVQPGDVVLDIAAGTGVVGFAAAHQVGEGGRVIVSDFADGMVEAATRHAAALGLDNVECRVLDAENLELADDTVDAVVCRWGYMLMPNPATAFAETRRVLRPGGRLTAAVFAGPAENQWAALPMQVMVQQGLVQPPPGTPGILALADRDRLRALFVQAGFNEPQIEDITFSWTFRDGDEYWQFLNEAAGAVAALIAQLDDEARAQVRQELLGRLEPFATDTGLDMPALSVVASAT